MVVRRVVFGRILALEAVAFLLVATVLWLDELIDLPHLLFGAPHSVPRLAECAFESLLTILLGAGVVAVTRRAFRRIQYLESLVVMCAWCRHHARTTHGICDACAAAAVPPDS